MNASELKAEITKIETELSSNDYLKSKPQLVDKANEKLKKLKADLVVAEGGGSGKLPEVMEIVNSKNLKKHQKIYLLSQRGFSNKEIATHLGTNVGHVWNALNEYKNNPDKVKEAEAIKP